jgi:hypothetical protein
MSKSESDSESELEYSSNSESSILKKMMETQNEYYNKNSKNSFFKKSQKMDCAKEICKQIDIYDMIANSIYVILNTNKIYIDYSMFKLYANPDNFDIIISHIINTCKYLITYHKNFEVFVNLEKFSVSAAERYKGFIQRYVSQCLNENTDFSTLMTKMNILNSPSVIELIVKVIKPIVDKNIVDKVFFYKKEESMNIIKNLK